jgi:1-acyl-sn-glycerol-3-phosphate acyltransferase
VPDAEIIPIGGSGPAGRGSRTSPSAAARALAPPLANKTAAVRRAPRAKPKLAAAKLAEAKVAEAEPLHVEHSSPVESPSQTGQAEASSAEEPDLERRIAEFLAFVRRRITGEYRVDQFGYDAELTERFLMTVLRPIAQRWFRIEARGLENIPADGGALVVSNHSGTLPLDGLMTSLVLYDATGRALRSLGADLVFTMPFVGELARKGGATLACKEDAERMLSAGELVGVWPEGFKGLGKPFSERYKLQRFGRGGFVSAAMRAGAPIIPCSVVGAEETYPMIGNLASAARLLGLPYLPLTPFFPWLGLLGLVPLPSKWLIEFGEPIRTDQLGDGAADDPMLVFNVTDQVRETIQQTLYALLMRREGVFS